MLNALVNCLLYTVLLNKLIFKLINTNKAYILWHQILNLYAFSNILRIDGNLNSVKK